MYWPNHAAFSYPLYLAVLWSKNCVPLLPSTQTLGNFGNSPEIFAIPQHPTCVTHQNCPFPGLGSERRAEIKFNRQKQMRRR